MSESSKYGGTILKDQQKILFFCRKGLQDSELVHDFDWEIAQHVPLIEITLLTDHVLLCFMCQDYSYVLICFICQDYSYVLLCFMCLVY